MSGMSKYSTYIHAEMLEIFVFRIYTRLNCEDKRWENHMTLTFFSRMNSVTIEEFQQFYQQGVKKGVMLKKLIFLKIIMRKSEKYYNS